MKKTIALILSAAMLMTVLAACGGDSDSSSSAGNAGASSGASTNTSVTPLTSGLVEKTGIVITSIGQSADADIVATLMGKIGVDAYTKGTISADELTSSYKTLILAVGGSSKGLGAAGIDATQELARADALVAKAQSLGMKILVMHTGGAERRGTLSDGFIEPMFKIADCAIVISTGDSDNMMRNIITANKIPADFVDDVTGVMASLQTLFA